jgi:hypothetical protein
MKMWIVMIYVATIVANISDRAAASELFGFRIGMSEAEAWDVARRNQYRLPPTSSPGAYIVSDSSGMEGSISICRGKLFSANRSFDGDLHTFISLVREWRNRYGEPQWKTQQSYSTAGEQLSILLAEWDDPIGQVQPGISTTLYGKNGNKLRINIINDAYKYVCQR